MPTHKTSRSTTLTAPSFVHFLLPPLLSFLLLYFLFCLFKQHIEYLLSSTSPFSLLILLPRLCAVVCRRFVCCPYLHLFLPLLLFVKHTMKQQTNTGQKKKRKNLRCPAMFNGCRHIPLRDHHPPALSLPLLCHQCCIHMHIAYSLAPYSSSCYSVPRQLLQQLPVQHQYKTNKKTSSCLSPATVSSRRRRCCAYNWPKGMSSPL